MNHDARPPVLAPAPTRPTHDIRMVAACAGTSTGPGCIGSCARAPTSCSQGRVRQIEGQRFATGQPLNQREAAVYEFMRAYFATNGMLPSSTAIAEARFMCQSTANHYQQVLVAKGWLERNAVGKLRFAREVG